MLPSIGSAAGDDVDQITLGEPNDEAAVQVELEESRQDSPQNRESFDGFRKHLSAVLWTELNGLRARLGG